jgi:hypothetical protein
LADEFVAIPDISPFVVSLKDGQTRERYPEQNFEQKTSVGYRNGLQKGRHCDEQFPRVAPVLPKAVSKSRPRNSRRKSLGKAIA